VKRESPRTRFWQSIRAGLFAIAVLIMGRHPDFSHLTYIGLGGFIGAGALYLEYRKMLQGVWFQARIHELGFQYKGVAYLFKDRDMILEKEASWKLLYKDKFFEIAKEEFFRISDAPDTGTEALATSARDFPPVEPERT